MEKMLGLARVQQQQSMSSFFNDITSMRSSVIPSSSSSSTSSSGNGQYLSIPNMEIDYENDIFEEPYELASPISAREIGCSSQMQQSINTMCQRVQEMYSHETAHNSNFKDSADIEMVVTKCTPATA